VCKRKNYPVKHSTPFERRTSFNVTGSLPKYNQEEADIQYVLIFGGF
jgi:hypothetical protein